jgi:CheY-like chemotaxis protein
MLRVLIVEDTPINMRLVATILSRAGHEVLQAENANDAIRVARVSHPDVILMDLGLPDMDGLEATRVLKKDPSTRDIAIIAVTAFAMEADKDRALGAGCDGFMSKPIDRQQLISAIQSIVRDPAGPRFP